MHRPVLLDDPVLGAGSVQDEGEIVAVLGANGAGKTTLLKTACGALDCTKGQVVFRGEDVVRRRLSRDEPLLAYRGGAAPERGELPKRVIPPR